MNSKPIFSSSRIRKTALVAFSALAISSPFFSAQLKAEIPTAIVRTVDSPTNHTKPTLPSISNSSVSNLSKQKSSITPSSLSSSTNSSEGYMSKPVLQAGFLNIVSLVIAGATVAMIIVAVGANLLWRLTERLSYGPSDKKNRQRPDGKASTPASL
jgi:hypothetical protein